MFDATGTITFLRNGRLEIRMGYDGECLINEPDDVEYFIKHVLPFVMDRRAILVKAIRHLELQQQLLQLQSQQPTRPTQ